MAKMTPEFPCSVWLLAPLLFPFLLSIFTTPCSHSMPAISTHEVHIKNINKTRVSPKTEANCWQALAADQHAEQTCRGIQERNAFFYRIVLSAWSGLASEAEGERRRDGAPAGTRIPSARGPHACSLRLLCSLHMLPRPKQVFPLSKLETAPRRCRWQGKWSQVVGVRQVQGQLSDLGQVYSLS